MPANAKKRRQLNEETTNRKRPQVHQEHCAAPDGNERAFACPFGRLAPNRYPTCAVHAGHSTVSYLKQHLERAHQTSELHVECPRCHKHWKKTKKGSNEEYAKHIRAWKCEPRGEIDPFSPDELKRLAKGLAEDQSGGDQVQKWNWIWDTFFAGHSRPGSPYAAKFGGFLEAMKPVFRAFFVSQPALKNGHVDELIDALKEHLRVKPEPFRRVAPSSPSTTQAISLQRQESSFLTDGAGGPARDVPQPAMMSQLDGQPFYQNLSGLENPVQIDGTFIPISQPEPTSFVECDPTPQFLPASTASAAQALDQTIPGLDPREWVQVFDPYYDQNSFNSN
jgi:hypothetical protein